MPSCWFFIKEAKSIRGIPDIIGCINGRFFALELKSAKSFSKDTGRQALQTYRLRQIYEANGFGAFCYPENFERVMEALTDYASYGNRIPPEEL